MREQRVIHVQRSSKSIKEEILSFFYPVQNDLYKLIVQITNSMYKNTPQINFVPLILQVPM